MLVNEHTCAIFFVFGDNREPVPLRLHRAEPFSRRKSRPVVSDT